ncbi:MAG: hypothetical protein Q9225_005876 [Loekoesia sp. 1 TL-2023]
MGVSTNGSTCVTGNMDGDESLFIIGGSIDGSQRDYSGMQRFSFKSKKWETCNPAVNVTKNRLRHGSTFLSQSSSILIYGGSQDGDTALPSSQTFLVSATSPYAVQAFSSHAPPVISPLMMPWNRSHALMLGGDPENKKLFTFGPSDGWHQLEPSLDRGLPNANQVQATIMDGSDGSKLLELFNLDTSPNQISTLLLQQPTTGATSSQPPGTPTSTSPSSSSLTSRSSRKRKRVTLAERPAYNSTLAPQVTRDGFSIASDPPSGLVVASGGNSQDVLCMFNQTSNQWIDAAQFFGSKQQDPSASPTKVQSPASSLTGQPPPPSNPPAATSGDTTHRSLTILGGVLGGIFGLAALCLLLLLLLRYVRKRREREDQRRRSGYPLDDKHGMDFMDRGDDHMRGAGGSFGHKHAHSGNSTASATADSRAASAQSKRGIPHKPSGSGGSAKSFFSRSKSPTHPPPVISEPIMHPPPGERNFSSKPMESPEPRTEPRTDTGWSKYWAHNSNTNFGSNGVNRHESAASQPTAYTSGSRSDYTTSRSTDPHQSAEVEPLNIRTSQLASNSRVVSPTSGLPLPGLALSHSNHGVVGPEPHSPSTMVSDIDEEDEYRLDHPPSNEGQDSWTPVRTSEHGSTWTDPRVSSVYADSMIYPHPGERVRIPNFPGVPTSRRPSNNTVNNSNRGMRSTAARDFGRGPPQTTVEQMPMPGDSTQREQDQLERERMARLEPYRLQADTAARNQQQPDARTFPRRPEELGPRGRGGAETEDMSWLNLGR